MTKYTKHVQNWNNCKKCDLCNYRSRVVFARGKIPCDILFIGEAPGDSEDVIGKPLVGPAGILLDSMIELAIETTQLIHVRVAFYNLVGCIPKVPVEGVMGRKKRDPHAKEIETCGKRLIQFYKMAKPEVIVTLGELSKKWVPKILPHDIERIANIMHPAAILRMDVARRGLAQQRCEVQLVDAFDLVIPF